MDDNAYDDQPEEEPHPLPENWAEMFSNEPIDQSLEDSSEQPAELDDTSAEDLDAQRGERYKSNPGSVAEDVFIEQEYQSSEENQQPYEVKETLTLAETGGEWGGQDQPQADDFVNTVSSDQDLLPNVDNQEPSVDRDKWISIDSEIPRGERDTIHPEKAADTPSADQEEQSTGESQQESTPEPENNVTEPDSSFTPVSNPQFNVQESPEISFVQIPAEANPRKIALILSGGGARGAFQVGAEKYAREVKGYQWDIIAGVSVGAMNGAMLAMHRFTRLLELWDTITDSQVYTGGFNLFSLVKILFGAKSFYGNQPLIRLMQHEFEAGRVLDDLHVGAVSIISGEYMQFTRESLELPKAILASASIPVVWPPVDISPDHPGMVDGGVRNITPVGDVLDLEPDEIVIINCGKEQPPVLPGAASNVLSIGMRALDIMQNEIFANDMKEFQRINALVREAEQQGCVLHHPKSGRPLKYYPCQVIEPDGELGEVLDFSQKSIQAALRMGVRRAREVLGRPGTSQL